MAGLIEFEGLEQRLGVTTTLRFLRRQNKSVAADLLCRAHLAPGPPCDGMPPEEGGDQKSEQIDPMVTPDEMGQFMAENARDLLVAHALSELHRHHDNRAGAADPKKRNDGGVHGADSGALA